MKPCMLAISCLLAASPLFGQETRGAIFGLVTDSSASAIVGATVTVVNVETNVVTALKTNDTGYYEAPLLIPGNYRVSVETSGFRKAMREGIALAAGAHLGVDFRLEVGAVSDAVTVTADPPLVNTDTLTSGLVVDSKTIMNVPWPGDNVMTLVALTPGAQTATTFADNSIRLHSGLPSSGATVSGGVGGNEFSLDGASNQVGRGTGFNPPSEMIEAVRVETSGFDATVGHSTGMNVSLMTKAGTNQFHGALRESYDQSSWAALDFFTKQGYYQRIASANAAGNHELADSIAKTPPISPYHDNQFAATIGGPVTIPKLISGKNKLFFFFGYAGYRVNQYRGSLATFPTEAMRAGDLSALLNVNATNYQVYDPLSTRPDPDRPGHVTRDPIPGNRIPTSRVINPVYKFYSEYLPDPNALPASNLQPLNDYIVTSTPYQENYNAYTNRYDYNMNASNRVMFRWEWNQWRNAGPNWQHFSPTGIDLSKGAGQVRHNVGAGLDYVHNFGANTLLDINAAIINYYTLNLAGEFANHSPSSVGFPAYLDTKTSSAPLLPGMNWSGWTGFAPVLGPGITRDRVLSLKADLVRQVNRHTVKAGVDFRAQYYLAFTPGNNAGVFNFDSTWTQRTDDGAGAAGTGQFAGSWAAFMMGLPTTASADTNASSAAYNPYVGMYVQDNWRVSSRLSLNFGLRVEHVGGGTERYNRLTSEFDPKLQLPITAAAQAAYAANPAPELPASAFSALGGGTYAGANGVPREVWNSSTVWLPRISAAFQLNHKTVIRAGAGTFSDSRSIQNESLNQLGFSWATSTTFSNDFGRTWLVGNPAAGVSPMTDPFPVLANGQRFLTPPGSALGGMAPVGRGLTYVVYDRPPAAQYRWRLDVQRQLGQSTVINVGYAGSYAEHILVTQNLSAVPAQYWNYSATRNNDVAALWNTNLPNPFNISNFQSLQTSDPLLYQYLSTSSFFTSATIRKSALLAAFPQMNGLNRSVPLGRARTHELDLMVTRRFSHSFNVNAAYTRFGNWAADYFPNPFDQSPAFEPTNIGRPHRITSSAVVTLPFGKGQPLLNHGIASKLAGGFQVTILQEYQPGALVPFSSTSFYSGDLSDICSTGPHTLAQWFNTSGFVVNPTLTANTGQARVFPNYISGYGGCRGDSLKRANASAARDFKIKERWTVQFRWDVYNVTNHSQFQTPVTNPAATNFGQVTATVGGSGGTPTTNRSMRAMLRILF